MRILNNLKEVFAQPSIDDADYYAHVAREIEAGQMREGVWAKACAEADFDDRKARGIYMRMAVAILKKEQNKNQKKLAASIKEHANNQKELARQSSEARRIDDRNLRRQAVEADLTRVSKQLCEYYYTPAAKAKIGHSRFQLALLLFFVLIPLSAITFLIPELMFTFENLMKVIFIEGVVLFFVWLSLSFFDAEKRELERKQQRLKSRVAELS
jgi:hypothetical protein